MSRGALAVRIACTALALSMHAELSSRALAAGTWSFAPASTFQGTVAAGSIHEIPPCPGPPPLNCPPPPNPGVVNGFIPGFAGNSFGRITVAECDEHFPFLNCHWWGRSSAWTVVDGVGTNTVQMSATAWSDTSRHCDCPGWGPVFGAATVDTHLELTINTVPPGQSVTVNFAWFAVMYRVTKHEGPGEDAAFVQGLNGVPGVTFEINGTPLVGPGAGVNALPATANATLFLPGNPAQSTGFILAQDGDTIVIDFEADVGATINPPPIPASLLDQSNASFFGKIVLSIDTPVPAFPNPMAPTSGAVVEFSLDIGSDSEMSDPSIEGNEVFDPGDTYPWFGPLLPPGGADGVRDDALVFQTDYWPLAPDGPPPLTGAATCSSPAPPPPLLLQERFDLDGTDAIAAELRFIIPQNQALGAPLSPADLGATGCVHRDPYLLISFNDDAAAHYSLSFCPVPSESPSDAGFTYGSNGQNDEVLMVSTAPVWPPPASGTPMVFVNATTPVVSEGALHVNLAPSVTPGTSQAFDDDVDALDVDVGGASCGTWYVTADHEATGLHPAIPGMPLDGGDIYEVLPLGGVTKVIDHAIHLGLPDGVDIDGFEFVFIRRCNPGAPTSCPDQFAILFSVDQNDPATPPDESGGRDPRMIYASFMTDEDGDGIAEHFPYLTSPLQDNIDAIAASPLPFVPVVPCPGNIVSAGASFQRVDVDDMLGVITNWGPCPPPCPPACLASVNGDCFVNVNDLLLVILNWGPCP